MAVQPLCVESDSSSLQLSLMQFCGCQKKLLQMCEEIVIGNMSQQKNSERRKKTTNHTIPEDSLGEEKKRKCLKIP